MTAPQLYALPAGAAIMMIGGPILILHAFFYRAERLILKKRARVLTHIYGACAVFTLAMLFIDFFLPKWEWLQWVNLAAFVLAFVVSYRRYFVWYISVYRINSEWSAADLARVNEFIFEQLKHDMTIEVVGAEHLSIIVKSVPQVVRRFRLVGMDRQQFLSEMAETLHKLATYNSQNRHPHVDYCCVTPEDQPIKSITTSHVGWMTRARVL